MFAPQTPRSVSIRRFYAAVPCRKKLTASCASSVRDRLVADGAVRHDSVAVRRQTADAGLSRVQRKHSACVLKLYWRAVETKWQTDRALQHSNCCTRYSDSNAWGFKRAMKGIGDLLGKCRSVLYAQPCGMSAPHGRIRPCPHTLRRTPRRGHFQGQVPVQILAGTWNAAPLAVWPEAGQHPAFEVSAASHRRGQGRREFASCA